MHNDTLCYEQVQKSANQKVRTVSDTTIQLVFQEHHDQDEDKTMTYLLVIHDLMYFLCRMTLSYKNVQIQVGELSKYVEEMTLVMEME